MFLYIKTNILRGYGIFENDFAHSREPASMTWTHLGAVISLLLEAAEAAAAHQATAGRRMEVPAPRSTPHSAATVTVQPGSSSPAPATPDTIFRIRSTSWADM